MIKEGSLSLSSKHVIVRFGYGLEFILGYSAEEMIGKDFSCLTLPETQEGHKAALDSAQWGSSLSSRRTKLLHKNGSPIDLYMSVYPLRDLSGALYSYIITLSLTKDAHAPAILSEEFQRIFRFSNDAVAVTDRNGGIIDVNQNFLDTYGYTREEVIGQNPRMVKSPHSTPEFYERMWRDILDPDKGWWRGEIINIRKDGKEIPVLLSINAIKDADGEIQNFLGIALDMSREKELDRVNKMYIDFIIHDMRNPLMGIMTNAELMLMQKDIELPDKMKKRLQIIFSCSEKLSHMTSDILDYSRAQSGSLVLRRELVSIASIMRHAVMPFEHLGKKLFLNGFIYDEKTLANMQANVDADKLQRIIYNLLSNAFKNASSEVRLLLTLTDKELKLVVTDDGKGISEREAAKIFEVFYQTDEGIKTGGAGLGLNIVKSFVEAHGGTVWVEPDHGKGATFGISLPLG